MVLSRESLDDLYKSGKEYDVSPFQDGSAMIYMRKLGPTQQGVAVREANSARIKTTLLAEDPDNVETLEIRKDLESLSRDQKVEQLALASIAEERQKAEQEVSDKEKWLDDGKLQALVDAWESGLMVDYMAGEKKRSKESERVFDEMKEFTDAVDEKTKNKLEVAKVKFEKCSDEVLDGKMIKAQIEYDASLSWMRVFRMHQILYGVHNLERERMYDAMEDVETIPAELFAKFIDAIADLALPAIEVKS